MSEDAKSPASETGDDSSPDGSQAEPQTAATAETPNPPPPVQTKGEAGSPKKKGAKNQAMLDDLNEDRRVTTIAKEFHAALLANSNLTVGVGLAGLCEDELCERLADVSVKHAYAHIRAVKKATEATSPA